MKRSPELEKALSHHLWKNHIVGDLYTMDGLPDRWKIIYYPLFENNRTKEIYTEPRALMENIDKQGFWRKETPLRYLDPVK